MSGRIFKLVHQQARDGAARYIATEAPDGYVVTIKEPTRNLEQNALMWVLLQAFADQLVWPVNGSIGKMTKEEWKEVLSAAFHRETVRLAMGMDGGVVMLGQHTSKMGKGEFAEFVDFIHATAVLRGVVIDREAVAA